MQRTILSLSLLFAASLARAAPFVVSDPVDPATSQCGVFVDAAAKVTIPVTVTIAPAGKICKHDLAGIAVGAHTIAMTAITVADPIWGTAESVKSVPLAFTKPASTVATPAGLGLSP